LAPLQLLVSNGGSKPAIIIRLLGSPDPVSFDGEFFRVHHLKMTPPLSRDLIPGIFVSGSSEAGLAAAQTLGATAVKYPKPAGEYDGNSLEVSNSGVRIGIITREVDDDAWKVAYERFPVDRKGQLTHQMAMKVSDSSWHKQLSRLAVEAKTQRTPYWLVPFENYKTFCPYLVGSYEVVSKELAVYVGAGYHTFILDIPPNEEELARIGFVFEMVARKVVASRHSALCEQPSVTSSESA
jgi:alkanesulfonate monooxygenase